MIRGDGPSKAVLCGARTSTTPPPRYESKQNARLDIFFFASDVAQTPVAVGDDASRRRCPSSTRIITLSVNPPTLTVALVNIFSGNRAAVVAAAALPHSPGPPEMNPCMSGLSLCICADGKHDRVRFSTSLNKSLECFNPQRE